MSEGSGDIRPRYERTGIPLVDAVVDAMMCAFEEGRAKERGDEAAAEAAHRDSLLALVEVQFILHRLTPSVPPPTRNAGGTSAEQRNGKR